MRGIPCGASHARNSATDVMLGYVRPSRVWASKHYNASYPFVLVLSIAVLVLDSWMFGFRVGVRVPGLRPEYEYDESGSPAPS